MAKPRSPTLAPHAMRLLMLQCIASGLGAHEFGRRNGISRDQCTRMAKLIKDESIASGTNRTTSQGSIIPANAAKNLSTLSNRMVNGMINAGTRAIEQLEMLNAKYAPRKAPTKDDPDHVEIPQIDRDDLPVYKFAWSTCERIVTLARKDGRDEAPPVDLGLVEPIQRTMDAQPAGMLTVVPAAPATGVQGDESDA